MKDPTMLPYAKWLEESIRKMAGMDVKSIALAAITGEKEVMTAYYDACFADMAVMAANIQADGIFDMTLANARMIVEAAEEQENDDG